MKLISLALIAAFAAAGSAQAQAPTPAQGQTLSPEQHARAEACKDEMKSLCSGKQGQEAAQCLQANSSKLSPKCKASVSK
jgi:predicted secreted protein